MNDEKVILEGLRKFGWSPELIKIAMEAKFKCEYCKKKLLENTENFKEWHFDHIVPINKGGTDTLDNFALSCRTCNINWKGWWYDPRLDSNADFSRDQLIAACREYVRKRKQDAEKVLREIREITGE